jgi:sugar lactone lactonase YvrE
VYYDVGSDSYGIFFKPDGTKMYRVNTSSIIYQYTLSTPWDVSTASYDSKSFDMRGTCTNVHNFYIGNSGDTLFAASETDDYVYQFDLTTSWDISSAGYSNNSYLHPSTDPRLWGITFSADGKTMFTSDFGCADTIWQSNLSTAWDLDTASDAEKSFNTQDQGVSGSAIFLSPDGDKLYQVNSNDNIYQYGLDTPNDISTAYYTSRTTNVTSEESSTYAIAFKTDGEYMYIAGLSSNKVHRYELG